MSKKYTFAILGGDLRQAVVARKLLALGHNIKIFGFGNLSGEIPGAEIHLSLEKAILGCDAILLPLPTSRDGILLNLFSSEKKDSPILSDIIKHASKNTMPLIIGGMIPKGMREYADSLSVDTVDYYESEELQKKNALPSAEGALMVAMENTDKVIYGMKVLIGGYGRIGKLLADRLKKLGAHVSVAARRDEVLCEIAMSGYVPIKIGDVKEMCKAVTQCDVIFNTVPGIIFSGKMLESEGIKPLYIEIASSPGGIDIPSAREKGYQIIFAPSLPGKYAPSSAGEYIFETISDILINRGIKL
jgi:dipicolinate synthase subunit A